MTFCSIPYLFTVSNYKKNCTLLCNYSNVITIKNNFLKVGASQVDIVDIKNDNMISMLDYDIIYGLGGNPYYLIELNRNSKFREILIEFLKRGIYIGESAGSMILCDDLKWVYITKKGTKPKYDIELNTYAGLNLTNYKIFPHWNKTTDDIKEKVEIYENETGIMITKLNDGEYITINY